MLHTSKETETQIGDLLPGEDSKSQSRQKSTCPPGNVYQMTSASNRDPPFPIYALPNEEEKRHVLCSVNRALLSLEY